MNLQNIFNELEKTDPEIYDRLDSRRNVMHRFTNLGSKIALTALPFALGGMLNKAYGQTSSDIVGVLNFALTLEYLESGFYNTAVGTSGLIDASQMASFADIQDDENAHVAFLTATITSLGGTPVTKPEFDYTAQGTFPTVFSNYQTFLAVSQTFEDTGVRAYKGQAGNLITNNGVLTAALQIHSVEARHASHVRKVRMLTGADANEKPWITGNSTNGIGAAVQASYNGEDNVTQLGIDVTTLPGVSVASATEAFDEPLTMEAVLAIVGPFMK
ncbi:MAG: ferritin-like domain-containing protein [Parafilimonas sp.]